jgi:spore coat polysaccharide biosynthesis protein SpsF
MVFMSNHTLVILQARMSSSRLTGKVMMKINEQPMIYWQIQRILESKNVNQLVVVTSDQSTDDPLVDFLQQNAVDVHRGSLNNVLSRFHEVNMKYSSDAFIRLTGDCPLVMPDLIDKMVEQFYEQDVDYLSNTLIPTFPDGLDIEVLKHGVLEKLADFQLGESELEHVTYGVYKRPEIFKLSNFLNEFDRSQDRWTVDYLEDLNFVREIFKNFSGKETKFTYQDVCSFLEASPELLKRNENHKRNEQLNTHRKPV